MFTDDDLKQLEEYIADGDGYTPPRIVKALLVRLKVAEKVIITGHNDDSGTMEVCISPCDACIARAEWRKVSGKLR